MHSAADRQTVEWVFLQIAGMIVLGWVAVSVVVAIGWSLVMRAARDIERSA
jgi:hypothetical protein